MIVSDCGLAGGQHVESTLWIKTFSCTESVVSMTNGRVNQGGRVTATSMVYDVETLGFPRRGSNVWSTRITVVDLNITW